MFLKMVSRYAAYYDKSSSFLTMALIQPPSLPSFSFLSPHRIDRLHGFFTPKTYMEHYCRLSGLKDEQAAKSVTSNTGRSDEECGRQEHIDEIFDGLGLTSHKDTIVGDVFLKGLSGGQKRRLSVALEALSSPKNFFLDEPTR
jgi:ABC-type multidrug transport system ATPase subunit